MILITELDESKKKSIFGEIKSLYEDYFDTDQDASIFAEEFYFAVGELLKGKKRKDLNIKFLENEKK